MKKYRYVLGRTFMGGFSNSFSRLVLNTLPVYTFIFIRHFFIGLLSLFFYRKKNRFSDDWVIIRHSKRLQIQIVISCLLSSVGTMLFYQALKLLPVSMVSLFENGVYMIFTVLLSILFLGEKLRKRSILYLSLCLVGLFLIITKGSFDGLDVSVAGLLLLTVNALLSSTESVITASSLKHISAMTNTAFKSFSSAFAGLVMVFVYQESLVDTWKLLSVALLFFLLYSVVSGFIIKYLHSRSIQELGSSKTAIFTLLTPLFSSFFAMVIFQEWFTFSQYAGVGLILYSLYKLK